jgi:hypothetical protein
MRIGLAILAAVLSSPVCYFLVQDLMQRRKKTKEKADDPGA